MKILSLSIENHKKIRTFFLDMNGEHVTFAGDCGTGKTTAASALWTVMQSGQDILRHDAKSGKISIKLGDGTGTIIAERRFTPKTNTITLTTSTGVPLSIKQFRQMISELSCNPHDILQKTGKELVNALLSAADLGGVDIVGLDQTIEQLERDRLDAKRLLDLSRAGIEPDDADPVDVAKIASMRTERLLNAAKRDSVIAEGKKLYAAQKAAEARLADAQEQLAAAKKAVSEKTAEYEAVKGLPTETADLDRSLEIAAAVNAKAAKHAEWVKAKEREDAQRQAHAKLDSEVKAKREIRKQTLEHAKWPLEGLRIVDGQVMYHESLLENLGTSEQTLVCAALARNDILKHPLRVARIDKIECMSKQDFAALLKLFGDADIQVISTRVARDGAEDGEIVIVDGVYGEEAKADSEQQEQRIGPSDPIPTPPKCPDEGPASDDGHGTDVLIDTADTDGGDENPFG